MRAAHTLAAYLGMSVAALMASVSAQEFTRWMLWMQLEQQGPAWDAHRHAQLLAGVHNSGKVKHAEGRLFTAADFERADPWAPPPTPAAQLSPQELKRQHAAWLARQEA